MTTIDDVNQVPVFTSKSGASLWLGVYAALLSRANGNTWATQQADLAVETYRARNPAGYDPQPVDRGLLPMQQVLEKK